MGKRRAASTDTERTEVSRTSVVLDPPLKENLRCLAQRNGQPQGQIIRDALRYYLTEKEKLDPDKFPRLTMQISY